MMTPVVRFTCDHWLEESLRPVLNGSYRSHLPGLCYTRGLGMAEPRTIRRQAQQNEVATKRSK